MNEEATHRTHGVLGMSQGKSMPLIDLLMAEAKGVGQLAEIYRERNDMTQYRHYQGRKDGIKRGLALLLTEDNEQLSTLIDRLCHDAYETYELANTYRLQNDVMQYRYYEGRYDGLRRVVTSVVCGLDVCNNDDPRVR